MFTWKENPGQKPRNHWRGRLAPPQRRWWRYLGTGRCGLNITTTTTTIREGNRERWSGVSDRGSSGVYQAENSCWTGCCRSVLKPVEESSVGTLMCLLVEVLGVLRCVGSAGFKKLRLDLSILSSLGLFCSPLKHFSHIKRFTVALLLLHFPRRRNQGSEEKVSWPWTWNFPGLNRGHAAASSHPCLENPAAVLSPLSFLSSFLLSSVPRRLQRFCLFPSFLLFLLLLLSHSHSYPSLRLLLSLSLSFVLSLLTCDVISGL